MASTSVRVDQKTLATIRELSKSERKPIGQVIADAVKRYEDEKMRDLRDCVPTPCMECVSA